MIQFHVFMNSIMVQFHDFFQFIIFLTVKATMWLGTEDGTIHVYNCTDNIRIKKNKDKFCHPAPVLAIL